jgi:hypothetical protein
MSDKAQSPLDVVEGRALDALSTSKLTLLTAVYLALLVTFTVAGVRAPAQPRVVMLGHLHTGTWVAGCGCWILEFEGIGTPVTYLRVDRAAPPAAGASVLVVGRLNSRSGDHVLTESVWHISLPNPGARGVVSWLRANRLLPTILLLVLVAYGSSALRIFQLVAAALGAAAAAALALDLGALHLQIAFPDELWVLTLAYVAAVGAHLALRADRRMEGKFRSTAATFATGILSGGGLFGAALGFLVPILSQRLALPFMIAMCFSAALQLDPRSDLFIALVICLLAGIDRWWHSGKTR